MLKKVIVTTSFCAIIAAAFLLNSTFNKTNVEVISEIMPGTVEIFSTIKDPFNSGITDLLNESLKKNGKTPLEPHLLEKSSLGSGVIIDKNGYIITNNHVVDKGIKFEVKLNNDTTVDAKLIGTDKVLDLAVLKIDVKENQNLKVLEFGDSSKIKTGEEVYVIGNPFGQEKSVSHGIVSNPHRTNPNSYEDLIQTDAAMNRGNSGGGLFNRFGKIIGINEEIYSPTGASIGLGMAIPSNTVSEIAHKIISGQHIVHPALGIEISNIDDFTKSVINYDNNKGVFVSKVMDDSPNKGILMDNDVIYSYDSQITNNTKDLLDLVRASDINKTYHVYVYRGNEILYLNIKLKDLN